MGTVEFYEGKRESYWTYRVDLPPEPGKTRKQHRVTKDRTTGARWTSKRACQKAMRAHEAELLTGVPIQATQQTMSQFMEQWLTDVSSRIAPSTVRSYRNCWKQVAPHLGAIEVQNLQSLAIQQVIRELEKRYAPDTVRLTHTVVHAGLKQAVQWQIIPRNPADGIVLPASKQVRLKNTWTVEETQRFLAGTRRDTFHALWRLLLDTGMRIGEALALSWAHVNLDPPTPRVRIERTITRSRNDWYIGDKTKTRRSRRTLSIQPETADALRAWLRDQESRQAAFGSEWNDLNLVFDRNDGSLMHPKYAERRLAQACVAAGVPHLTPHALRHTFTTLAAQRGVPLKLIADRLGHANTNLIADVYAHATEEGDRLVTEALRDLLSPPISAFESEPCQESLEGGETPSD